MKIRQTIITNINYFFPNCGESFNLGNMILYLFVIASESNLLQWVELYAAITVITEERVDKNKKITNFTNNTFSFFKTILFYLLL